MDASGRGSGSCRPASRSLRSDTRTLRGNGTAPRRNISQWGTRLSQIKVDWRLEAGRRRGRRRHGSTSRGNSSTVMGHCTLWRQMESDLHTAGGRPQVYATHGDICHTRGHPGQPQGPPRPHQWRAFSSLCPSAQAVDPDLTRWLVR